MNLLLDRKVVAIAGAGAGIGRATAIAVGDEGCHLVLGARQRDQLDLLEQTLHTHGTRTASVCTDLSQSTGMSELTDHAVAAFGGLDGLVISIGGTPLGDISQLADEEWSTAVDQKLMAAVRGVNAARPHMRRRGGGSIVLVAGNSSRRADRQLTTSAVVNSALERLAAHLASHLGPEGIAVNAVSPGPVRTSRYEHLLSALAQAPGAEHEAERALLSSIPDGRVAEPQEVAATIAFLLSPLSRHITGQTLVIDGGQSVV